MQVQAKRVYRLWVTMNRRNLEQCGLLYWLAMSSLFLVSGYLRLPPYQGITIHQQRLWSAHWGEAD